jgi:iron complex transport system substrate-binding protein
MTSRPLLGVVITLLLALGLVLTACGDSPPTATTTTVLPTTAVATTTTAVVAPTTALTSVGGVTTQTAATTATAANSTTVASQGAISVTDNTGTVITLAKKAERIACLGAHCLDVLAELGLTPVGIEEIYFELGPVYLTDAKYWANKLDSISRIKFGANATPNLEDLAKLQPDLIIATSTTTFREALKNVAPIYATKYRTLAQRLESLQDIGKLTGREIQASAAIKRFETKLAAYAAQSPKNKTLLYNQSYDLTTAATPMVDSPTGEVLKQVTKYPWSSDKASPTNGWAPLSVEKILEVDPDVILVGALQGTATNDFLKNAQANLIKNRDALNLNPIWKELKAVKSNQVFEADLLNWQGQGTIALTLVLDEAMTKLYPQVFPKALP